MSKIKAQLQIEKEIHISLPACQIVSQLKFSPRLENGRIVFDIFGPDGTKINHIKKPKQVLTNSKQLS